MFKIFKKGKKSQDLSRTEFAKSFNFDDKKYTKALIYRACHIQDTSAADITGKIGKIKNWEAEKNINELCATSIATVASHIVIEAAERNDIESVFMLFKEVPKHAVLLIAFTCLITLFIKVQTDADGIETDFNDLAIRGTVTFFPLWENEKIHPHIVAGENIFKRFCSSDEENVKQWISNLRQATDFFILQWTSEKEEVKKIDVEELFGKLLKTALNVMT